MASPLTVQALPPCRLSRARKQVVIITDVALGEADFQRHLFYTGMTRASESVRVLCDKKSQKTLIGWLTGEG